MAGIVLFAEEVKWTVITIVLAVSVLVIVIGMNAFLNRSVDADNTEFLLEKEYVKGKIVHDGILNVSKLEEVDISNEFGVMIEVDGSKYYANKLRYDEKVFCNISKRYVCRNYDEVYVVEGKPEIVRISMVMKRV